MKLNFDLMMRHFHGTDKEELALIVRSRMAAHAEIDNNNENIKRQRLEVARQRAAAATKIKVWYKDTKSDRIFKKFIAAVMYLKEQKDKKRLQAEGSAITNG